MFAAFSPLATLVSLKPVLCSRILALTLVTLPLAAAAQAPPAPLIQGTSPNALHMEAERQKLVADERQQKLQNDADKLLLMAQQLKVSVDKTSRNTLSVQVVRQAESIEKLARQVKDGMRQ